MFRSLIAMMLMVAPICTARAQAAADSGARIRFTTVNDARTKNGTLISLTPDTLVYHPGFMLSVSRTPLDSIRSIDRSRGRVLSGQNMIIGAAIGALVGVGVTAAVVGLPHNSDGPGSAVAIVALGPILVGGGLIAGGWIGAEHRTESWSQLYPDIADASMIVGPTSHNSFSFGLSVPYDVPLSIEDDVPPDSAGPSTEP